MNISRTIELPNVTSFKSIADKALESFVSTTADKMLESSPQKVRNELKRLVATGNCSEAIYRRIIDRYNLLRQIRKLETQGFTFQFRSNALGGNV